MQTILEPVKQQAVIISYDYLLVQQARETQWPRVGVVLEQWQDIDSEIVRNIASDYIFVDHEIIPQTISQKFSVYGTNCCLRSRQFSPCHRVASKRGFYV